MSLLFTFFSKIKQFIKKYKKIFITLLSLWLSYVALITITIIYGYFVIQPAEHVVQHDEYASNNGYEFNLGMSNVNLIKAKDGYLLIDGGDHKREDAFEGMLKEAGITKKDIKYIFITHHHHDHVGLINHIKEESNPIIIMHKDAREPIEKGKMDLSLIHNSTKRAAFLMFAFGHAGDHGANNNSEATTFTYKDIFITQDNSTILRSIGVNGNIIVTPGHSNDSISIIMDDGRAFVGDTAENWMTFDGTCHRPMNITNEAELKDSWNKLMSVGAKVIYPGHGEVFNVDELSSCMNQF